MTVGDVYEGPLAVGLLWVMYMRDHWLWGDWWVIVIVGEHWLVGDSEDKSWLWWGQEFGQSTGTIVGKWVLSKFPNQSLSVVEARVLNYRN